MCLDNQRLPGYLTGFFLGLPYIYETFKLSLQQISLVLLTCLPAPLYLFNLLLSRLLFAEKWHASISSFFPWIYFFRVCLCICVCRDQSSLLVLGHVNMFFKKDAVTLK